MAERNERTEQPCGDERCALLRGVALFPLPNVVLFPRAVLPLHIFEERYKDMTADALAGQRRIAMALLRPGWEQNYYQRPAIEPVVCVGTILTHEKLPDGKYNFLLQGQTRARIVREQTGRTYRTVDLKPIVESPTMEIDLLNHRQRLVRWFSEDEPAGAMSSQFRQLLAGPLNTADIADLVAFNLLDNVSLKQSLLAEADVVQRVERVLQSMEAARPALQTAAMTSAQQPGMN